jgi:uncharacterized protein with ParB-like and HNH nuclease domain/predicted transport protein
MKATEAKLLDFLRKSPQFVIPIYQRTYSWTEKECRQLWDDILRTGSNDSVSVHFIGSIVYIEKGLSQVSSQSPLLVIDGQQRLTTVTLLIAALAKALGDVEPVDGFSPRKLRNYYLLNPEEEGERRYKLLLSQTDKTTLISILASNETPKEPSVRVTQNFTHFEAWIGGYKSDLTAICKGLAKLVVVDIALNRDQDNPQLIFESMNSTGRELSQADLIRNFVLMGLEPHLQTHLYEQYWRPMEVGFGQQAYSAQFDSFMRHYLIVKTGEIPNVNEVYEAFKKHARSTEAAKAGVEVLVKDIRDFARYFCAIALEAEPNPELKAAFDDIRELKVDVAYPFLMELYSDYAAGILPTSDFVAAVRLVDAYVFRRYVCSVPTNSANKTFATFAKALKKDHYLESIRAHFLGMSSYRRFPDDEEFSRELQTRDVYTGNTRRNYWLRRLENFDRKERVPVNEYTIEHILPQNENLSHQWRAALGPEWERIRNTWLHTIGNLTLTGYNSEYSDRPFTEKRDMKGGFKESPLRLNEDLRLLDQWNEDAIQARAARLAEKALQVWPAPKLPADVLAVYKPKADLASYGLQDHPPLLSGPMREVFEAFRKEVLALDPCVSEEIFKTCIAYKAETNFVDLVPQIKRLQLTLNMKLLDLEDPKNLCEDVSEVGHLGYGDVRVTLTAIGDLPYVMGLVRQSFEKQMGNGTEA